mgnify:CR=1 FL=1
MTLSEHAEQALVVRQLRESGYLVLSIPNEGKRTGASAARFAQRGLLPGAPDLLVLDAPQSSSATWAAPPPTVRDPGLHAGRPWVGLAIEFKRAKGGRLQDNQGAVLLRMNKLGWLTLVAHGATEALEQLHALGYRVGRLGPMSSEDRRSEAGHLLGANSRPATTPSV